MVFNRADRAGQALRKVRNLMRDMNVKKIPGLDETKEQDLQGALRWSLLGGRDDFIQMLCREGEVDL